MGYFEVAHYRDLAYSGQKAEYANCSRFIGQLVALLEDLGSSRKPPMFFVPGNHDMLRSPETISLSRLPPSAWEPDQIDDAYLRRVLWNALEPYDACAHGWRYPRVNWGTTLGDFSGDLDKDGHTVGVLGINTAVNQGGADSPTWVPFDRHRVEEVLKSSVDRWAEKRRLRVLLPHHPPRDFRFFHWNTDLPAGKGGFQIHFCSRSRTKEPQSIRSSRDLLVIEAPDFSPVGGGGIGYSAGFVDLENPISASIWDRSFSQKTNAWQGTGGSIAPSSVYPLPVANLLKTLKPLREAIYIESLSLKDFRSFDSLKLQFNRPSRLEGRWTCIAGINGAGKSSVLQALGLALLGNPLAADLQSGRLNRMRRMAGGDRQRAEIDVRLRTAETNRHINLQLEINDYGIASHGGPPFAPASPAPLWDEIRSYVIAGYGATRNLSSQVEHGTDALGPDVRRLITLFDPLRQLSAAEVLLTEQSEDGPLVPLFQNLLAGLFGAELLVEGGRDGIRFTVGNKDRVEAVDLPDGFRAAAWIADLCAIWCEKAPELAAKGDPADIQAIVLLDEIDLHLHPSLQRELVPRLRKTLPRVQWIVTTHSPLVLANFDANEIIALDRDSDEACGSWTDRSSDSHQTRFIAG